MKMKRRSFLGALTAGIAAAVAPKSKTPAPPRPSRYDMKVSPEGDLSWNEVNRHVPGVGVTMCDTLELSTSSASRLSSQWPARGKKWR
jgi:hypothetical protein